jgi:hypothetical protein
LGSSSLEDGVPSLISVTSVSDVPSSAVPVLNIATLFDESSDLLTNTGNPRNGGLIAFIKRSGFFNGSSEDKSDFFNLGTIEGGIYKAVLCFVS